MSIAQDPYRVRLAVLSSTTRHDILYVISKKATFDVGLSERGQGKRAEELLQYLGIIRFDSFV